MSICLSLSASSLNSVSVYTDIGQVALPLIAGLYSFHKKDYAGIAWLIGSLVVNQIGIDTLKKITNQKRPNGKEGSFPSGNTAAAFLGPCFLVSRYGLPLSNPLVAGCTLAATMVGIGRVVINVHWPRDILGGALLGYAVSLIVPHM